MVDKKHLFLVLKNKWYDMIASGLKKEEYREIKTTNVSKLFNWRDSGLSLINFTNNLKELGNDSTLWVYLKDFGNVTFSRAYTSTTATYDFQYIFIGDAYPQWSDNWQGKCFVIKLGEEIKK